MSEPQKFRRVPMVFEAVQWDGSRGGPTFTALYDFCPVVVGVWEGKLHIDTMEGTIQASPNDWIVKGSKGEFWPVKPDIFAATYEPLPDGYCRECGGTHT